MSGLDRNKRLVTNFFAAVNDRRIDLVGRYLASDVVDHNKIIFGEPDEPGAALDGFRQQLDAFGTGRLDPPGADRGGRPRGCQGAGVRGAHRLSPSHA